MTELEQEGHEVRAAQLKLGATYKHYKTKGLYVPLQFIFFAAELSVFYEPLMVVTFTGNGPNENENVDLVLSLRTMQLFMLPRGFKKPSDDAHVLYYSKEHQRYFVRPLQEFVARVVPEDINGNKVSGWTVPRFERVEG